MLALTQLNHCSCPDVVFTIYHLLCYSARIDMFFFAIIHLADKCGSLPRLDQIPLRGRTSI
jgi:hypothetical protein